MGVEKIGEFWVNWSVETDFTWMPGFHNRATKTADWVAPFGRNSHYRKLKQWPFQDPKLEVPTIYKAYVRLV